MIWSAVPTWRVVRIVLFPESATKMLSALASATPVGYLNRTVLPLPLVLPVLPDKPASVLTTPAGVIFRIVELLLSATYTLPAPPPVLQGRKSELRSLFHQQRLHFAEILPTWSQFGPK